ncbi:YceI family protein [Symbioplanes lichenis]|uniref:YceI family protein n=1 Tax=Symbioplanes lichenis TaxID=1629072 RepID=UPI002738E6BA|nr:YceI family protein [Actinoplanes lichenis]
MNDRPTRLWNGVTIPEPGVYLLDEAHKRVGFQAQHMMVSVVRGEFADARAHIVVGEDPLRTTVTASIRTGSLTTHNDDRDVHLRGPDFLDVDRYPAIRFRGTGLTRQEPRDEIFMWARLRNNPLTRRGAGAATPEDAALNPNKFVLHGELTVKDVRRPVDVHVDFGGAGRDPYGNDIFGFTATADIDREDFGLVWNVALEAGGVLVGKKIRIEIAGEAIRQ